MYPEPSSRDHNAPWNVTDDGECDCSMCKRQRITEWEDERRIDNQEAGYED
jgi:hypothetical protein